MESCPLCGSEIVEGSLRDHVSNSHSKEDLLNALFDDSNRVSLHHTGSAGNTAESLIQVPNSSATPQQQQQAPQQHQQTMMLMLPLLIPPHQNNTGPPPPPLLYATPQGPPPASQTIQYDDPITNVQAVPTKKIDVSNSSSLPQIKNKTEVTVTNTTKAPQLIKKTETVHSIDELKKILKADEDFQIIVSSEFAESDEFINLMKNMNKGAVVDVDKSSKLSKKSPSSPQPCSSRDISQGGFEDPVRNMKEEEEELGRADDEREEVVDEDEDDITLQDLVALETMEEDCIDEDQYFTLNSNNPLQPYVNSIIHQQQQEQQEQQKQQLEEQEQEQVMSNTSFENFSCEMCGTKMNYFGELSVHLEKKCKKLMELKKLEKSKMALNISSEMSLKEGNLKEFGSEKTSHSSSSINQPALGTDGHHWKCYICLKVFSSGPQLLEHLLMIKAAPYKCSLCHLIFNSQRLAKDHKKNSHSLVTDASEKNVIDPSPNHNGEYVCDKCDRAFKDKDMLIKHMNCHVEDKPFECSECGKKFSKITLLKCHYKRHFEVGNYECMICQKRFFTPSKLKEHIRVHTGETPLTCDVCNKSFKRHSNLSDHKKNVHGESTPKVPKELFCTCGKLFTTQRDLDWHYEAEHENKPKKCKYCGEIFVHNSILTRHIRLKHEENFIPTHRKSSLYAKCPICDQLFYKTSIPKHIRIKHHGQKLFNCDICKRSFTTKHSLVEHQWQHKGVTSRPYKCHICPKAYLRPNLLEAHVNSHKGIKPYVCNECGTKFVTKSNWQRHVQEHSGSRNFECPRCLKKFSRAYYLTDHLKVHTGEKPYSCGICGKRTATKSNYNSHLRTHITRDPINSEV